MAAGADCGDWPAGYLLPAPPRYARCAELMGFVIVPGGDVYPCSSGIGFAQLRLGNIEAEAIESVVRRAMADDALRRLHDNGPFYLYEACAESGESARLAAGYVSACQFHRHVLADPTLAAVAAAANTEDDPRRRHPVTRQEIRMRKIFFNTLVLETIDRCNARCAMCYQAAGPRGSDIRGDGHLSLDVVQRVIDEAAALPELTGDRVHVSGGESFLNYQEMLAIFHHARSTGFSHVGATTNAFWALNDAVAERKCAELAAAGVTYFEVSIDFAAAVCVGRACTMSAPRHATDRSSRDSQNAFEPDASPSRAVEDVPGRRIAAGRDRQRQGAARWGAARSQSRRPRSTTATASKAVASSS